MFGLFGLFRLSGAQRSGGSEGLFEALESRVLLSFSWTPEEVFLSELVNRARADPAAEGVRFGVDLTADLTPAELARLVPQEPLALNADLTVASRLHTQDMADRDFFDHVNPDGLDPTDRAVAAGYVGVAGENIAAGQQSVLEAHIAWLKSVGHRKNVLSLHDNFDASFHYDEFGPGFAFTDIGPFFDFYGELFGFQSASAQKFVLGVVYTDRDGDDFYSVGEGASAIRVDVVDPADPSVIVGTYTTDSAGNYQIQVPGGDYILRFTNVISGRVLAQRITVGQENVKVDATTDQINFDPNDPGVPTDDHANAGDFAQATPLSVSDSTGDGSDLGTIHDATDTDLFRYDAPGTGPASFFVGLPGGTLSPTVRLFGPDQRELLVQSQPTPGALVEARFNVVQGRTYYVQVEPSGGGVGAGQVGDYSVFVGGPALGDSAPVLSTRAPGGSRVHVGAGDDGSFGVSVQNVDGRSLVFVRNPTGQWSAVDLDAVAGGPEGTGSLQSWVDRKDGLVYVAKAVDEGLFLYRRDAGGIWSVRNLTRGIAGAATITGAMTVFTSVPGQVYVGGLDSAGDLVLYHQTGGASGGRFDWSFKDVTAEDLTPAGVSTPQFVGSMISYVTPWNGLNIAGLDAQGRIRAIWWAPGLSAWRSSDLSASTGAPTLTGGLTAFVTPWKGVNLAGVDESGALSVTWWVPSFGGNWRTSDLSGLIGGPTLSAQSLSSFVTPWGALNIAGLDSQGKVRVYWWAQTTSAWRVAPLSDVIPNAPLPADRISGVTASTGSISLFGTTGDGDVVRYTWSPGSTWGAEDLTTLAGV